MPCVVLAGGKAKPDLYALTGEENRALVVVQGKRMLDTVVEAVQGSGSVNALAVVGSVPESSRYERLEDAGSFVGNVFSGAKHFSASPYLLICTSDLPFLTPSSVARFVEQAQKRAEESQAALLYPIIPVARCYERFPSVKRTSLKLREGTFTGGNLMLVRPRILAEQQARVAEAYEARKSPLRLATMLGMGTVVRLLLSQTLSPNLLAIPYLEAGVSRLLGAEARAVICDDVEIATDLDRPSDFEALGITAVRS